MKLDLSEAGVTGYIAVAVAVAAALGAVLTYRLIWRASLIFKVGRKALYFAYALAVAAFPFSVLLGVTVGASLGGGVGAQLFGLHLGVPIGIGSGFAGVTALTCGMAAMAGLLISKVIGSR